VASGKPGTRPPSAAPSPIDHAAGCPARIRPFKVAVQNARLEAIKKAEELQPDLILLNIGLPKLNGLETARRARELAPLAKILFISQEFSYDMVEAALRLGAQGYVHKRAQSDLLPAVETILRGKYFVSGVIKGALVRPRLISLPFATKYSFALMMQFL
jgi:DNA-binding NarL/FixJ family response regulator